MEQYGLAVADDESLVDLFGTGAKKKNVRPARSAFAGPGKVAVQFPIIFQPFSKRARSKGACMGGENNAAVINDKGGGVQAQGAL